MASSGAAAKWSDCSPRPKRKSARSARCASVVAGGSLRMSAHSLGSASSCSSAALIWREAKVEAKVEVKVEVVEEVVHVVEVQ